MEMELSSQSLSLMEQDYMVVPVQVTLEKTEME